MPFLSPIASPSSARRPARGNPRARVLWLALPVLLLSACAVRNDYVRPGSPAPSEWYEKSRWKTAEPQDALPRGSWWSVFADPGLDAMMARIELNNQNVLRAQALYRQAQALVASARAPMLPSVTGSATATRSRSSATTVATPSATTLSRGVVENFNLPFSATWEADVWGRIARTVDASEAGAQATLADLESARLAAQASLAQAWFSVRGLDTQARLLDETLAAYAKSLSLTQSRYEGGVASRADVAQAQAQLKSTQAQRLDLGVQRAQWLHAIAVLTGLPVAEVELAARPLETAPPVVPAGLPSQLLERRPDIAAAERRVAQASAQVGAARAALFPTLNLNAGTGFATANTAQWLTVPSRFWSIGPALVAPIFDGGLRRAAVEQAQAGFEAAVAAYRQTVLTSFQEVEDNLAALRILEEEQSLQADAVVAAEQALTVALNQYRAGLASYLQVVSAQTVALSNQRAAADVLARRHQAAVQLVRALGGGWQAGPELAVTGPR